MRTRLRTVEEVRSVLGDQVEAIRVRLPSGRMIDVTTQSPHLDRRIQGWLQRYGVWRPDPQEEGGTPACPILLTTNAFTFGVQASHVTLEGIDTDIRYAAEQIAVYEDTRQRYQRSRDALEVEIANPAAPTTLTDVEQLLTTWPDALGVVVGPYQSALGYVPSRTLAVGFMPVVFMSAGGSVALTSTIFPIVPLDAGRIGRRWADGQSVVAHPHIERAYCLGDGQSALHAAVVSRQMGAALDLIRHWRRGYNSHDAYGTQWSGKAWMQLASIRGGFTSPLLGWDAMSVVRADTDEIVRLDSLVEDIDLAAHAAMRLSASNQVYLSGRLIADVVGGQSPAPPACVSCGQPTKRCLCHVTFCTGCHNKPENCVCPGSPALLLRFTAPLSVGGRTYTLSQPDLGSPVQTWPTSGQCPRCERNVSDHPAPGVISLAKSPLHMPYIPLTWTTVCSQNVDLKAVLRNNSTLTEGVYDRWRIRYEELLEGGTTPNDNTHTESGPDDAPSGEGGAAT